MQADMKLLQQEMESAGEEVGMEIPNFEDLKNKYKES